MLRQIQQTNRKENEVKAYIAIKYYEDFRNKYEIEMISSVLQQLGFDTCCIARDFENWGNVTFNAKKLMDITFQELGRCDLIILDLSEKGVGLGIEAGYAFAIGKPVITIARTGSDISKTLRGISTRVIFYDNAHDIYAKLTGIKEAVYSLKNNRKI